MLNRSDSDTGKNGANRIPVLMYHRIGTTANSWERKYCVTPELFSEQMKLLANHHFRPCSIEDFVAWLSGSTQLPQKSILLTFDDGFYGVYEYAMPVLSELEWPSTVFLVSSLIGKTDTWCQTENPSGNVYPLLGLDHILEMRKHRFSFQSHSSTHADLTKISDHQLREELYGSRIKLEDLLETNIPYLAYPYGRYDDRTLAAARAAGYSAAFSVQPGFNRPGLDLYRIRRLDVFGTDTAIQLLRKINLGSNDGTWLNSIRYYANRFKSKLISGDHS